MQFQRKAIEHYSYSLGDVIGKGFSSVVYKGINDMTKEQVSIKVVARSMQEQIQLLVIQNEITTLTNLKGTNILKLLNYYYTPNTIYIITEYCPHGDLAEYLKNYGRISSAAATKIIRQIVEGLKCLVAQGIIHRDLKPSNILINKDVIKIADFGFAKPLNALKNEMNLGTPLYMSPETLARNEYNSKSDVWSLGIMFYEILYGVVPWPSQTEQELIYKMVNTRLEFPITPEMPNFIKDFISKCLIVDVNERYSILDLAEHPLIKSRRVREDRNDPKYIHITDPQTNISPLRKVEQRLIIKENPKEDVSKALAKKQPPKCECVIISQLEYMQFIAKIIAQLSKIRLTTPWINEKLTFLALKQINFMKQRLKEQFYEGNVMELKGWEEFKHTARYIKLYSKFSSTDSENYQYYQNIQNQLKAEPEFQLEIMQYDLDFAKEFNGTDHNNFCKVLFDQLKFAVVELNHMVYPQISCLNSTKPLSTKYDACNKGSISSRLQEIPNKLQDEILLLQRLTQYLSFVAKFKCHKQFNELRFSERSLISQKLKQNQKQFSYSNYLELRLHIKMLMSI